MSRYDKQDVNTYDETAEPEQLPPCGMTRAEALDRAYKAVGIYGVLRPSTRELEITERVAAELEAASRRAGQLADKGNKSLLLSKINHALSKVSYSSNADGSVTFQWAELEDALLTEFASASAPVEGERCVKCGHNDGVDRGGQCVHKLDVPADSVAVWDDNHCGHRCASVCPECHHDKALYIDGICRYIWLNKYNQRNECGHRCDFSRPAPYGNGMWPNHEAIRGIARRAAEKIINAREIWGGAGTPEEIAILPQKLASLIVAELTKE